MPVERKQPDFWFNPGAVRLYLHDLEEIDRLLRGVDGEIELEVDNYEATYRLSALEELAQVPGDDKLREIRWSRWRPAGTLTVHLSDKHVYVIGSPALRGALEEVADVLRRRRRPLASVVQPPWRLLVFWVAWWLVLNVLVNLGVPALERAGAEVPAFVGIGCILAGTGVFAFLLWRLVWRPGVVLRVHRRDRPSFWRRNRDQLIVGLIAASSGSVLGYLLAHLLGSR